MAPAAVLDFDIFDFAAVQQPFDGRLEVVLRESRGAVSFSANVVGA
jgi:hypothetical protein